MARWGRSQRTGAADDGPASPLRTYFIETYGCQMNIADSEVVRSVLEGPPLQLLPAEAAESADVVLVNTCAVREHAELRVEQRIKFFQSLQKRPLGADEAAGPRRRKMPLIGVLGCMARRQRTHLLETVRVDLVAGPDAYRELPALLLRAANGSSIASEAAQRSSLNETYADIAPLRAAEDRARRVHGFVTVQRGCDNHCAFCVVPFTRGRERSVPAEAVVAQVRRLVVEDGVKEVVLLGQNVNAYFDATATGADLAPPESELLARGFFRRVRRPQSARGADFATLLRRVAAIDRDVRVRFQSPHPQSFPDRLLRAVRDEPNVCKALHMPAQHGATSVLQRMDRGYSAEAYRALVARVRATLSPRHPTSGADVGLSTDVIVGFCGETPAEHCASLALLREVGFDQAFLYAYSSRLQTPAATGARRQSDSVAADEKQRRLREAIDAFQRTAQLRNALFETGRLRVVLVEAAADASPSSPSSPWRWTGRCDSNKRALVAAPPFGVLDAVPLGDEAIAALRDWLLRLEALEVALPPDAQSLPPDTAALTTLLAQAAVATGAAAVAATDVVRPRSYVVVKIVEARGHTLRAVPLLRTTLLQAHALLRPELPQLPLPPPPGAGPV